MLDLNFNLFLEQIHILCSPYPKTSDTAWSPTVLHILAYSSYTNFNSFAIAPKSLYTENAWWFQWHNHRGMKYHHVFIFMLFNRNSIFFFFFLNGTFLCLTSITKKLVTNTLVLVACFSSHELAIDWWNIILLALTALQVMQPSS